MSTSESTPRIDALLSSLRSALVRSAWLHGLGTVLAASAGWLLLAFLLDRYLHVPGPVRFFHAAVLVALPLVLIWKYLAKPLGCMPDRTGLAVLADRACEDKDDIFVSAVQLNGKISGPAQALVTRLVQAGEERAPRVVLEPVLERRAPRRRALAAVGAMLVTGAVLGVQPAMARIFFQRLLGGDVPWPQRTHLFVEVPLTQERGHVSVSDDVIVVRAARGVDIPVLVRAEGDVPSEVILSFDGGFESAVASSGGNLFRTRLPSVQRDTEFRVRGGDDRDGQPLVRIEVLQPPDVAGLAFVCVPPTYTGLAPRTVFGTDVEVIAGTRVSVHVLPDPPDATGAARVFPSDRKYDLERAPFPRPEDSAGVPVDGLTFAFDADSSLRFSVDLVDASGLPNPDPGLFGVTVREDRRPTLTLLAPGRVELDVVESGAIPLRLRIEDDFGVADVAWSVRRQPDLEVELAAGTLETRAAELIDESTFAGRDVRVATTRIEVAAITRTEGLGSGDQVQLQVLAHDNREPLPGEAQSAPVRLRIVTGDEYERRLKEHLAQAGEKAAALDASIQKYETQLRDLLGTLAGDGQGSEAGSANEMAFGARRMSGDARALARDLAGLAEGYLYSRLDPRGGTLLEAVDKALAKEAERGFRPDPWRSLASAYRAGNLGQADFAAELVLLVGLGLDISEDHTTSIAVELENTIPRGAGVTQAGAELEAVSKALAATAVARTAIDELVTRLGEWDNFQSVLTLTRDILNRQRNVTERTKKFAEDH